MGDYTLKIQGGIINSFDINTSLRRPISMDIGVNGEQHYISDLVPEYVDTTIKLMVPFGQVVYELTKEQRIRNKLVGNCTIDELLFAIQKKLEEKI
jgi:hypothetical protein